VIVELSDNVTVPVERRSANPPDTWKKPPTRTSKLPDASISEPKPPSTFNVFVDVGPVFTTSGCAS
jgi:hypothetical protein